MNYKIKYSLLLFCILLLNACKVEQKTDMVIWNGKIYTADSMHTVVEALAIHQGKILARGNNAEIKKWADPNTEVIDLHGQFVMPGLIDAHGHFIGLGESIIQLNLLHTQSWEEVIDSVKNRIAHTPKGQWIEGRGWHQEKWSRTPWNHVNGYPFHDSLSLISPDHPVILYHASGHALLANEKAMQEAGLTAETKSPSGGRIVKSADQKITGVFEENAMDIINHAFSESEKKISPDVLQMRITEKAMAASQQCIHYGITSFHDAGSAWSQLNILKNLTIKDSIKPRLYVMLYGDENEIKKYIDSLPIAHDAQYKFQSRSVKAYVDGALGSYGAWLLEEYSDKHQHFGQNTLSLESLENTADICSKNQIQLCVHGIGDKGNHEILNIFQKHINAIPNHRWRIEHAQHLHPNDIKRFAPMGVIASMQTIHCTSDAPFVVKRLGYQRAKEGAYAWRSLIASGARFANGTDCPVESINPFENMYAAVTRKRLDNQLEFFPEQALSRMEALHSYTLWNAYAAFEENIKGSLEKGKLADFIILDTDIITCTDEQLPHAKVVSVYMSGKKIK